MTKQTKMKRKRAAVRPKGRLAHTLSIIRQLNWKGWLIIAGALLVIAAAIAVPVALTSAKSAEQAAEAAMAQATPAPTAAPTPTPAPTVTPEPIPTTAPEPTPDPVLEKGDDGEHIQVLQERLMTLGYLEIDESTTHYGPATQYAVSLFQRQHDLQQDGIAGQETQQMIYSPDAKKYTLLEGTKGTDVDSLQRQLERMGYLDKVTGYYGTETIAAVKDFQERNDLRVDGKTGENTLDMIYSPEAKVHPSVDKAEKRRANILEVLDAAEKQLGKPYIRGNEGPNSYDCSGLVYYCLRVAGSSRGRYNAHGYSQVSEWDKITSFNDLEKGDLLFFWSSSSKTRIGHVGIYVGGGNMIDASSSNSKVVKRDCHWKSFAFARRPW